MPVMLLALSCMVTVALGFINRIHNSMIDCNNDWDVFHMVAITRWSH